MRARRKLSVRAFGLIKPDAANPIAPIAMPGGFIAMPLASDSSAAAHTTGARLIVDALLTHGVERVFCVPGESFLAVLDSLHDETERIQTIVCRHEAAAANMAEAVGKLTGRPGVAIVTRGPGATHASIGVHTAFQDSTPMILLIGQCARGHLDREAFQEIDYRRMFGQMAKWVAQIDDATRIPEYLSHAFHAATSGRPGPVVLSLPEDVLSDACAVVAGAPAYQRVAASPSAAQIEKLRELLERAQRPMLIAGGSGWTPEACVDLQRFVENWRLPVGLAFRFQDTLDNEHPNYAGDVGLGINPALAQRIRDADLLLTFGPRLGEATTNGYTLLDIPKTKQTLVHVHQGAEELGRVYAADLPIVSGMPELAAMLAALLPSSADALPWSGAAEEAHRAYLEWRKPRPIPGDVQMGEVIEQLRAHLPEDAILTNGAGNYATWLHRHFSYRHYRSQLAPTSGAMGYGVPAAIAAKSMYPQRAVVALAGDGCFMMSAQELATAMQYDLHVIFIVVNNGHFGTIRMHQERHYPNRVHGTGLTNPDFAAFARSFGAHGETVTRTDEFIPALHRAMEAKRAALIEIRMPQEASTPGATLEQIREQGRKLRGE
jgi:acetolactate synthase-1/2/3 large subunit